MSRISALLGNAVIPAFSLVIILVDSRIRDACMHAAGNEDVPDIKSVGAVGISGDKADLTDGDIKAYPGQRIDIVIQPVGAGAGWRIHYSGIP